MRIFVLMLLLISLKSYSQHNQFTGTWSNENCKDCKKEYIFTIKIAQSYYQLFGIAEISSDKKEVNSGIMDVSGYVYRLGDKAHIEFKTKDGRSASGVLYVNEGALQFSKRSGNNLIPNEIILDKLY
ncbi:hypothetical protein DMB65_02300 [Flavobacterium cheongpyeongense]|uniref:Uncharacterized protein n=1 Tax=Flavobacterium cheongpyeongense TaxID=2212651 RepID=A0A2V4BWK1_9FLAO|nr:hypothetical protein [Flavobacterium cheongpyeongense]PXY42090.1 hypothetical protein DMB65_02300 [Flavobacterium cheongpyeongense]